MRLQRQAPDPLYLQLKASLVAEIASGRYRSNQRLPSERELALRFHVSRMTVRQAMLELARNGTVYTRMGKGTSSCGRSPGSRRKSARAAPRRRAASWRRV